MAITLRGLTWDHPRGYAPLIGGAPEYESTHPDTKIVWERRSLRDFGEAPIEKLAERYDLLIVDHPFVGFAAAHDVLINLAPYINEAERQHFAADSIGPSWESYWYGAGLWALPIDAAAQVASYRPDLMRQFSIKVPTTLDAVFQLGEKTRKAGHFIVVPACPTDAISMFFTLSASLGCSISEDADPFVSQSVGLEILDWLHRLIALAHPSSVNWNPIQVYDFMASTSEVIYCPFGFGYTNYSRVGNKTPLKFCDPPAVVQGRAAVSVLGGAGVAVSSSSGYEEEAVAYARWLVTPEHQRGIYFREGGQPASRAAWTDATNDKHSGEMFSRTIRTLRSAYVRPRFDGFVPFFEAAGIEINKCFSGQVSDANLIDWLNKEYVARRMANR
jgi:multiple sugar transport system substrate-binding protein